MKIRSVMDWRVGATDIFAFDEGECVYALGVRISRDRERSLMLKGGRRAVRRLRSIVKRRLVGLIAKDPERFRKYEGAEVEIHWLRRDRLASLAELPTIQRTKW